MVSATVNSVTTTFAYRGDGLRNSRKVGGGATTTFTWNIAADRRTGLLGPRSSKEWFVGSAGGDFDIFVDDATEDGTQKVYLKRKGKGGAVMDTGHTTKCR